MSCEKGKEKNIRRKVETSRNINPHMYIWTVTLNKELETETGRRPWGSVMTAKLIPQQEAIVASLWKPVSTPGRFCLQLSPRAA